MQDTEFRQRVFNQELFDFCLEVVALGDSLTGVADSSGLLRKVIAEAFVINGSLPELLAFLRTLNYQDMRSFQPQLSSFFTGVRLTKGRSEVLFEEYLRTSRHLGERADFSAWSEFFKIPVHFSGAGEAALSDILMTVRHLIGRADFSEWTEFFKSQMHLSWASEATLSDSLMTIRHLVAEPAFTEWKEFFHALRTLSSADESDLREFFMTVRHLTLPTYRFSAWTEFFHAVAVLSGRSEPRAPFLTAIRHSLGYFHGREAATSLIRMLSEPVPASVFAAYSYGQLESKRWLIEETRKVCGRDWGTVFILAGWIGSLAHMIFATDDIQATKIRSFDFDAEACRLAEKLNQEQVREGWKFKSVCIDVTDLTYPETHYLVRRHDGSTCEMQDRADLIINTSCEHLERLEEWWSSIPSGTRVVLQSNDAAHIPEHIHCVSSLAEFQRQLPLSQTEFAGELELSDYKRFMLIGRK
jgi:hypothetical protein